MRVTQKKLRQRILVKGFIDGQSLTKNSLLSPILLFVRGYQRVEYLLVNLKTRKRIKN